MKLHPVLTKFSYLALWFLFLVVFEFCTGLVRGYILGKMIDNIVMYIKYFILTLVVLRKWKDEFVSYFAALHVFWGVSLFAFLYGLLINDKVSIVAWTNIIMALLGGWSGLGFYRSKRIISKVAIVGLGLSLLSALMYNYKYILYFNNFGTFTYIRDIWVNPALYSISDKNRETVHFEKDIIYIIDFWHTRCGYCFVEFPHFEEKTKNNTNPTIRYVSINYPLKVDKENEAFEVMEKYNYTFPVWMGSSQIDTAFGIKVYPTIVAFRNDTILYKGDLERLDEFLKTL